MSDLTKLKENLALILKEKEEQKKLDDAKRAEKNEADRSAIFESVGKDLGTVIGPYLDKLKEHSQLTSEELKRIISESVHVEVPGIDTTGLESILAGAFANFTIPTPQVHIKVPDIHVPPPIIEDVKIMNWPNVQKVLLESVDWRHPLAVIVVDEFGKPFYGSSASANGGSGPKPVMDIQDSRGVSLVDSTTNPAAPVLRTSATVTFPSSSIAATLVDSSGVAYSGSNPLPTTASVSLTLPSGPGDGATATRFIQAGDTVSSVMSASTGLNETTTDVLRVVQMTDAMNSVNVVQFGGTAVKVSQGDGANATGALNILPMVINPAGTHDRLRNNVGEAVGALRVVHAGDIGTSVSVTSITGPIAQGDAASALRVVLAGNADSSVSVTSITGPVAQGDAASALRVILAGNADSSVVVNSGTITSLTQFNGNTISTNQGDTSPGTLRVIHAGDASASVFITGQNDSMLTYMARTTAPTAKADGADVRPIADKLGRPVMRPMQVRDLITTAYVTLSTGTEATLLAASAGNFYDLIYILGANTSNAAQQVDIRSVTAGNIVMSLYIPANSTAGVSLPVPLPQDNQGNNWTVDMADVTNSNILISALFTKEV